MGADWLRERGKLPSPAKLDATHVHLLDADAADLERLFFAMQGEHWSPNGEAAPLIKGKGLEHTSMSIGDLAVDQDTWAVHIVDRFGFYEVHPGGNPIGEAEARMAAADDVTYPERRDE